MRNTGSGAMLGMMILAASAVAQDGQVTVSVRDEARQPVTNASVRAAFTTAIKPGHGWGAGRPNVVSGETDTNGICVLAGSGNGGSVGISASAPGYWGSSGYLVIFSNVSGLITKRWEPWNPIVDVLLQAIVNPIPLYAKKMLYVDIPRTNEVVGFDLIAGDWVSPDGKGEHADFLFLYTNAPARRVDSPHGPVDTYDYGLTITVSGPGDGLRLVPASHAVGRGPLILPREAPTNGYEREIVKRDYKDEDRKRHTSIREDANYFFRVRTETNEHGEVIGGLYGKVEGDFEIQHTGEVTFSYYLNPTPGDRNLEFDPKRNLFGSRSGQR